MNIRLDGQQIRQGNRFEYLGGTVTGNGKSEAEVWRIQVGVKAWMRVEGVMADRKILLWAGDRWRERPPGGGNYVASHRTPGIVGHRSG